MTVSLRRVMSEIDPKRATFAPDELERVRFQDVEGQYCWCGQLFSADDRGRAICTRCAEKYKEMVH